MAREEVTNIGPCECCGEATGTAATGTGTGTVGPCGGFCTYEWNGFAWQLLGLGSCDLFPIICVCNQPPDRPGAFFGETVTVGCDEGPPLGP